MMKPNPADIPPRLGHLWGAFKDQANKDSEDSLEKFVRIAKASPKPWPEELLLCMLDYAPQGVSSRHSEFMRWVNKVNYGHPFALEALEVCFAGGLSPARFIPRSRVSTLGVAAYITVPEVIELSYKYCSAEDARLKLLPEHLSSSEQWLVGSTLLHRLVERSKGSQHLETAEIILKHDPEACLQQRQDDIYPDGCGSNPVAQLCLKHRTALQRKELGQAVKGKGLDKKRALKI